MVWHPPHTYAHLTLEQAPRVDRPPQTLCCASYAPCLPLRGSDRRIEKRERESPVDKRGGDGVGGNR